MRWIVTLAASQIHVVSSDAVTMRPSGLNAAVFTRSSCPLSGSPIGSPLAASQISKDAVTMRLPSGLTAPHAPPAYPLNGWLTRLPLAASHIRAVPSNDAATTRRPSGLNVVLITAGSPTA